MTSAQPEEDLSPAGKSRMALPDCFYPQKGGQEVLVRQEAEHSLGAKVLRRNRPAVQLQAKNTKQCK